jgi:predicted phosphoadenosine phosphosulfate sulfurtransferase
MARLRHFIDIDVLAAAKARINHIYDLFDSVVVCFSGGKDSLATLHLCREVAADRGIHRIDALFRDEEIIPDQIIDFVASYRNLPWLNLKWFTVPLESDKFCLGKTTNYVQWGPGREWVRPKPEWGINLAPGDDRVMSQLTMDEYAASFFNGKIAFLTGIRAEESLVRYRASVNKLNDNYINASSSKRVSLCKPIYDWSENDVFKYFYESKIKYCPWYDQQIWAREKLRVATPLGSEAAKRYHRSIAVDPKFYDRVMRIFPSMGIQARYWQEFDREAVIRKYGQEGYAGVLRYIDIEMEDESQKQKARGLVNQAQRNEALGGSDYGVAEVLKLICSGQFRLTYGDGIGSAKTRVAK